MASINSYLLLFLVLPSLFFAEVSSQLSPTFYLKSCPSALHIIRKEVFSAVAKERRMAASLLRLHFHDCFVNGCDGSVLLDDTATFRGEKTAFPNANSARGFEVVDSIKSALEKACPQTVSCADILAVAARDSVLAVRGPFWRAVLGRRDSTTASFSDANSDLPPGFFDLNQLISSFAKKGFSAKEMVALSGSHTIGKARCTEFRDHIYKDDNINPFFAALRKKRCPSSPGSGDNNLAPLDKVTQNNFDNFYFKNLVRRKGLLHSDQELFNNASTDSIVLTYSRNKAAFFSDFKKAMKKMGNLDPLTGTSGEIRKSCRVVNS